jgi:hypothetical protein
MEKEGEKMSKFKIGDKVLIRGTQTVYTVTGIDLTNTIGILVTLDDISRCTIFESQLEHYMDPNQIQIGDKVTCCFVPNLILEVIYLKGSMVQCKYWTFDKTFLRQSWFTIDTLTKVMPKTEQNEINHSTHEVVDNIVLGKAFKHCRTCKKEVL